VFIEIYVEVDDFCKQNFVLLTKALRHCGLYKKNHPSHQLTRAEVTTILVYYPLSPYKHFNVFYTNHRQTDLKRNFPDLVSYDRFGALIPRALVPMMLFLAHRCQRSLRTGIYYIDSTPIETSHPKRAHQHEVFKGFAEWGKTSAGWFFGLKVHLLINHLGQLVSVRITSGSVHDSHPKVLFDLTKQLVGWVFGDKGYLLNAEKKAFVEGSGELHWAAKPRQGMKAADWPLAAKRYAKKRGIIETVIRQTKSVCDLEHSRHRSATNGFVNLYSALVAYTYYERKPSARVDLSDRLLTSDELTWALAA
jgi:Transposase DDE domain